jgi:hypothetical protein
MKKNVFKNIPPEKVDELDRLRQQAKHAEGHGQFDTVHHLMLARLMSELGLIPTRKNEDKKDGLDDGKQNA